MTAIEAVSRLETTPAGKPRCDEPCEMSKEQRDAASDLCCLRKQVITYFGGLPALIKNHRSAAFAAVTLNVGKGLEWFGPILDRYTFPHENVLGITVPKVTELGAELRALGIELMTEPNATDIERQIENTKLQLRLLKELKKGVAK